MEFLTKVIYKGSSPHAEDVVKILESLPKIKLNHSFYNVVGMKNILQACENTQIPLELRIRVIEMIGPLIQLGQTGEGEDFSHEIFLTLLSFATVHNNEEELSAFQTEVLEQLVTYLTRDQSQESLDEYLLILCTNYFVHTIQVNNLLRFLVQNWQDSKFTPALEKIKAKILNFTEAITQFNDDVLSDKAELNKKKLNAEVFKV
jgi:hypothetical protein